MGKVIKVIEISALASYLFFFIASEMNVIDVDVSGIIEKTMLLIVTFCIGYNWGYERGYDKRPPSKIRKSKNEE